MYQVYQVHKVYQVYQVHQVHQVYEVYQHLQVCSSPHLCQYFWEVITMEEVVSAAFSNYIRCHKVVPSSHVE